MNEEITQIVAVDIIPSAITLESTAAIASAITLESTAAIASTGEANLNPVSVYLSQLSFSSRRTMRGALETITKIVSKGELDAMPLSLGRVTLPAHPSDLRSIVRVLCSPQRQQNDGCTKSSVGGSLEAGVNVSGRLPGVTSTSPDFSLK